MYNPVLRNVTRTKIKGLSLNMQLSRFEETILRAVQNGMPMTRTPYRDLAQSVGIPTEQLLATLRQWQAAGKIRRLGAVVNHFQVGLGAGAMVVWQVPPDRVDAVGELFASFPKVSHVYRRSPRPQWPYNLYTMVHAAGADELAGRIETMSRQSGVTEFRPLKTVRELKKVPPTYIMEQ